MAPFILKSEGGLAETEEEAAANAAAAGVPYKPSRKGKKQDAAPANTDAPPADAPTEALAAVDLQK